MWKQLTIAASVVVLSSAVIAQAPAQEPGLGERIGESLDRGLRELGSELREEWNQVRGAVDRMGVQGRVYSRLHWDKDLASAELDLEVQANDVIVLSGSVASQAAKEKAVRLAQDTVGVREVVDRLTVAATTAPDNVRP